MFLNKLLPSAVKAVGRQGDTL